MDSMQSTFAKRLLVFLALVPFARADYHIDDQNFTSLLYSGNPGGTKWGPFQETGATLSVNLANGTMMTVNASQCFNHTYTSWRADAACTVADDCQVQIPFTGSRVLEGSGITIYVLQAGIHGINASLTIDRGAPKYKVLNPPPGPNFYTPNVTLFSVQGVTTGNHTATMTVQNWDNLFSGMMFDYAEINQTVVPTTTTSFVASSTVASTTSTVMSTATSSPTSKVKLTPSHSTINVGVIVGGFVGGLAALVALLLALFYLPKRRRKAPRLSANLDAEPKIEPFFSAESLYHQEAQQHMDVPELTTTESLVTDTVSAHAPPQLTSSASSPCEKSRLYIANPSSGRLASSSVTSLALAGSSTIVPPSESSRPGVQQTYSILTDDQADFVNNLYANNIPAATIARVIERMMAGERQPEVDGYNYLPPPIYYRGTGDE
ncbi:hypothetical protein OG21DRAFT_1524186 [Imleria badia]|nr:hypothetical protein OG21DRAFT_1524186 [Imleria badia]